MEKPKEVKPLEPEVKRIEPDIKPKPTELTLPLKSKLISPSKPHHKNKPIIILKKKPEQKSPIHEWTNVVEYLEKTLLSSIYIDRRQLDDICSAFHKIIKLRGRSPKILNDNAKEMFWQKRADIMRDYQFKSEIVIPLCIISDQLIDWWEKGSSPAEHNI